MKVSILADADAVAREAARLIAASAHEAISARGRFVVALSGGRTPWLTLRTLAALDVPWEAVHVVQVDERAAPHGHADRNLTHILESLVRRGALAPAHVHAMPVESEDLEAAAAGYAIAIEQLAGSPPVIDLVQLGLGPDGHTASLVPGDPVLDMPDRDVAATGVYQGWRRMTLTYPIINRARRTLWIVTGADKADALRRLLDGDETIPAGRVDSSPALVVADRAAAPGLREDPTGRSKEA